MRFAAQSDFEQGRRVYRKIVNLTSTVGMYGAPGRIAYGTAAGAVIGITKTVAREWAPFLVNCNAVARGDIAPNDEGTIKSRTFHIPKYSDDQREAKFVAWKPGFNQLEESQLGQHSIPLGRIGTPDDIAGAVAFLCGPESDFITGKVLEVNGLG
jgi:3-oxoacyl-[acyl-carrier protein] reductase